MTEAVAIQNQKPQRKMSQQMRAVVAIIGADQHLFNAIERFIDFDTESIFWDEIFKMPVGSGHRAAINVAYGIWTDQQRPQADFFSGSLSMDAKMQSAVLHALAIRWGLG